MNRPVVYHLLKHLDPGSFLGQASRPLVQSPYFKQPAHDQEIVCHPSPNYTVSQLVGDRQPPQPGVQNEFPHFGNDNLQRMLSECHP